MSNHNLGQPIRTTLATSDKYVVEVDGVNREIEVYNDFDTGVHTLVYTKPNINIENLGVLQQLEPYQRNAIIAALDGERVPEAGGVIASASLKQDVRDYESGLNQNPGGTDETLYSSDTGWTAKGNELFNEEERNELNTATNKNVKWAYEKSNNEFIPKEIEQTDLTKDLDPSYESVFDSLTKDQLDRLERAAMTSGTLSGTTNVEGINVSPASGPKIKKQIDLWRASKNPKSETDDKPPDEGAKAVEFPEFGRVDSILQELSLRNLKYPIDADYGRTQDYIQINQFTYKAPSGDVFFGSDKNKDKGGFNFPNIATEGLPSGTPKEKAIGLVKLPMPNSLADSNNVSWGPDQLNALTAAVASGVMGASNEAITGVINFIKAEGKGDRNIIQSLLAGLQGAGQFVGEKLNESSNALNTVGNQLTTEGSNLNVLGRSVLGSSLLNFLQQGVTPESILSRGAGLVPNNNLALLFNSPTLREFTFSWKMSPRSREEAIRVNNILRFFKQGMAPKKASDTKSGGASFFLGTPNIFDIHFKTSREKGSGYNQLFNRNDSVLRIKTCACTGAAVNYTPEGMWNAYEEGQPVAITLTLRFSELEPIYDTDYDNNYFNFDPQRTDLLPVPTDAVGY